MKYYTKEWYNLMQCLDYTMGMKKIPDRDYTDEEIKTLYQKKRKQFIAQEKRSYNEPPMRWNTEDYSGAGLFDGTDPETGESFRYIADLLYEKIPPKSEEEFSAYLESQYEQNMKQWKQRVPFDAERSGEVFDRMVRGREKYIPLKYPAWVSEQTDMRLPAMLLIPESVYTKLHKEELQNRAAWRKIERRAEKILAEHRRKLPKEIVDGFRFHDAEVLRIQRCGSNYEMLLNVEGAGGILPYTKVTFIGVTFVEREPGIYLRVNHGKNGEATSNCWYLYDELYAVPDGVEVHMMFNTNSLKYLTVRCRDIHFEAMQKVPV